MPGGDGDLGLQGAGAAAYGEALVGRAVQLEGVAAEPVTDALNLGEGGGAGLTGAGVELLAGVAQQLADASPTRFVGCS